MNNMLHPYLDNFLIVFIEEILIYSNNEEEHVEHLATVLRLLREHQFNPKLSVVATLTPSKILACIQISEPSLVFPLMVANTRAHPMSSCEVFSKFSCLNNSRILACWLLCHACDLILVSLKVFFMCLGFLHYVNTHRTHTQSCKHFRTSVITVVQRYITSIIMVVWRSITSVAQVLSRSSEDLSLVSCLSVLSLR